MTLAQIEANKHLDTCGLRCPEPVMLLHKCIREMAAGEIVKIIATDPSTQKDIPKFCHFLGHELMQQTQSPELYEYWVRKKVSP